MYKNERISDVLYNFGVARLRDVFTFFFTSTLTLEGLMKTLAILFGILGLMSSNLYAHGVAGRIIQGGLGLEAEYSDGSPMAYCRVKVYLEGDRLPFQTGVTDKNGRFLIYPDPPGKYRIVITDGMGHRLEEELISDKRGDMESGDPREKGETLQREYFWKVTVGIAGIIIFFLILKPFLKRKNVGNRNS